MSDSNLPPAAGNPINSPRKVYLVPPAKHRELVLKKPENKAAGMAGVKVALQHLRREMGFVAGMRVIGRMNQQDGFDCAGCAWPDPKTRSSLGEYCENGAKALAEEATDARIGPDFFQKYSVEALS
ncbi:MAG TPA: hypothetical protein ENJ82_01935, partial [Bacteroidetes bacterium]|nr:hypothetical protein [Bacteroidota bacterium]